MRSASIKSSGSLIYVETNIEFVYASSLLPSLPSSIQLTPYEEESSTIYWSNFYEPYIKLG
jgi:hypothetical protein